MTDSTATKRPSARSSSSCPLPALRRSVRSKICLAPPVAPNTTILHFPLSPTFSTPAHHRRQVLRYRLCDFAKLSKSELTAKCYHPHPSQMERSMSYHEK